MTREQIEQWLAYHDITKYTIHENLVVDVAGDVILYNNQLTELPFQFGTVTGSFYLHSNFLTSLQHCPTTVMEDFVCSDNFLTSLQYAPTTIGKTFICHNNPFIVTEENEESWLQAIKNDQEVYWYIKKPTELLTTFYKVLYAV